MKRAWMVVAVVVGGCHGPALPEIPGKGGPAWIELESEHFTLWTDGSRTRGRELIREMEHLQQVVLGVGFAGTRVEGKSLVLALRDSEEVGVFLPEQFVAFAYSGGAIRQGLIVLPSDVRDDNRPTITHELVHVISFNVISNQPSWFAEGLANFFASVNIDPDAASGDVGKPLDYIIARLRATPPTPAARMFACKNPACMDDMFYATAWAMVAYLANTFPKDFLRYAARLDEVGPDAAWQEIFPTLTPDNLDHEMRKWLAYGKHTVWKFNVQLRDWPITERKLGDADVLAARAIMRQLWAKPDAPPPPELAQALAADPAHLLAQLVNVSYTKSIAPDVAKRVADAHPDDWRAWWLVGFAAGWRGEDAHHAWEVACGLLAKRPSTWAPPEWCKH